MKPDILRVMRKIPILLLFLSLTVFIVSLTVFPLEDADIWHHLAYGKWVAEHSFRTSPVNPFLWSIENVKETNFEWLSGVGVYFLEKNFGLNSIIITKAVLIITAFSLLFLTSLYLKIPVVISLPVMVAGILASAERFIERLEHIGYFLMALLVCTGYYYLQRKTKGAGGKFGKFLYFFLPVLMMLWVNMHGSFIVGLVMIWIMAAAGFRRGLLSGRAAILIILLSGLAVMVHPDRFGIWNSVLYFLPYFNRESSFYLSKVYEFQSPFSATHSFMPYVFWFKILLFVYWGSFLVGVYRGRASKLGFTYLLLGTILAFSAVRNINIFVLLGFLPAMGALRSANSNIEYRNTKQIQIKEKIENFNRFKFLNFENWRLFRTSDFVFRILLILFFLTASFYIIKNGYSPGTTYRRFGLGVKPIIPDRAIKFLSANKISGNLLNQLEVGGYISWAGAGRKNFIDGFGNYPQWFFRQYLSMSESGEKMELVLDEFKIDYVLTLYPEGSSGKSVPDYLSVSAQWSLVFWDDYYLLFVKRKEQNLPLIERYGYSYADPLKLQREGYVARLEGSEGSILRRRVIDELERTVADNPDNSKAHTYLGSMYEGEGYWDEAIKEYEKAISKNSENPTPFLLLAGVYIKKEELGEAKKILEKVLKINPNLPSPYLILGQMEERDKNYREAMKLYNKALVRGPKIGAVYFRMGVIYSSAIYNKSKARQNLARAIELGLSDSEENLAKQILQSL